MACIVGPYVRTSRHRLVTLSFHLHQNVQKMLQSHTGSGHEAGNNFYPRDAMLARVIGTATCLSVRPSRAGIVSKRRKLAA